MDLISMAVLARALIALDSMIVIVVASAPASVGPTWIHSATPHLGLVYWLVSPSPRLHPKSNEPIS